MKTTKRTESIRIRVTPQEKKSFELKATRARMTLSNWLRLAGVHMAKLMVLAALAVSACRSGSLGELAVDAGHDCDTSHAVDAGADLAERPDGGMVPCSVNVEVPWLPTWKASVSATCETSALVVSAYFNSPEGPAMIALYRDGRQINVDVLMGNDSASCPGTIANSGDVWSVSSSCVNGSLTF